jgi:hypothetical protein
MQDLPSHPAAAPPADPAATLRETVWSVSVDAGEIARRLPGDDSNARVLDKLSEELAEAAQAHRALPGRPAPMSGHDYVLLMALRTAHAAGEDVGETIARALARLAAELGGMWQVLANRPRSWEARLVADLLQGTVGPGDENLPPYGPGAGGSL